MKLFKSCADGVHKFEARYDVIPPKVEQFSGIKTSIYGLIDAVKIFTRKKYIRDICVKCGKIVNL